MRGQGIEEIVAEVSRFTEEFKELDGLGDYKPFTDSEWAECYKHLSKLTHPHGLPNSIASLADLPLSTFIGGATPQSRRPSAHRCTRTHALHIPGRRLLHRRAAGHARPLHQHHERRLDGDGPARQAFQARQGQVLHPAVDIDAGGGKGPGDE
ncbi:uncharacterized protein LAJ45_08785 [Morchella importuna]|uniref:uncharacterized protein n=1 Tax=Morchella importuna TaxID=1174673 RepID=UPI001E8DF3A5|nr:uncharacterized protein LAJ45_08785 [Morchella importuna]KAH8147307.1 hypothetical protein LAJ45_08785 [Morchella importuna]